jgi:uncharacterized protein (TIGR00661 family)
MKIFYAVQATGNGHISRAMELLPYLQQYGEVDIFLSGSNSNLAFNGAVKYRSKGLSLFYSKSGGMSYGKTALHFNPIRLLKEARSLPVEKYDVVINDFESITALACGMKKIPSVNFGHQASFQSPKVPRPAAKDFLGEWVLKNYARASQYIGLHFDCYDDFIFSPIIKQEILHADPTDQGYITVYLPSYPDEHLMKHLTMRKKMQFRVFSRTTKAPAVHNNITFLPVDKQLFNESLINCSGIITGAGFETPAEALYLGKKLMVLPIKRQYEQQCNAAALAQLGVMKISAVDEDFSNHLVHWMNNCREIELNFSYTTQSIVEHLFNTYPYHKKVMETEMEEFLCNPSAGKHIVSAQGYLPASEE